MLTLILAIVLGLIGSLIVNYLSDVLPFTRKLSWPLCHNCQSSLPFRFYLFNSPCDDCGAKPSIRHWAVFIIGPILAVLMHQYPISNLGFWGGILWMVFFGLVVVIDLEHRLILHPISLTGAGLGFIFGSINHGVLDTFLGGAAGFGTMLILYLLGNLFIKLLSKIRGEEIDEVALGFGDVNLAGVIGLLLGWPGVVGGLFLAIILGGVVSGIFLMIQFIRKRYQALQALPYGPFLVLSTIILLVLSDLN